MISVLCVDDDSAYLDLTKNYLKEPGALVITTTHSATEALKEMETKRFDAGSSGYHVPGTGGIASPNVINHDVSLLFCAGTGASDP